MLVQLSKVTKNYGDLPIFDHLDFNLLEGDKIGLIGNNGCGKSSLFKIITGEEGLNHGAVSKKKQIKIGYIKQELPLGDQTAFDYVLESFEGINFLKRQLKKIEEKMALGDESLDKWLDRYGKAQEEFEALGGFSIEDRIISTLKGLGLENQIYLPISSTSGGERIRIELAKILISEIDVLLLDEPTNHLDLEGIIWLENYLKLTKKAFIVISHDREFLNHTVQKIIQLEDGQIKSYKGDYSNYVKLKKEEDERLQKSYELQQKEIERLKRLSRQFRQWGNEGDNEDFYRKAKEIEHRLERIERIKAPVQQKKRLKVQVDSPKKSGKEQIIVKNLGKTLGNKVIFEDSTFTVFKNEHLAILGKNGSGKSSLLKILIGQLDADIGAFKIAESTKIGYLPQNVSFPDANLRLVDFTKALIGNEQKAREELAKFAFYASDVTKRIKDLSGGEKLRLYLLSIFQEKINLLILDEPTNHLDIFAREEIEEIISNYQGTLLAVSHDRYFLKRNFQQSLVFKDGTVKKQEGLSVD